MPKVNASREVNITKFVDEAGNTVNPEYAGRKFEHITHKTLYSSSARACRGMLGVLAIVMTLGLALISKEVRDLLTKSTKFIWVEKSPVEPIETPKMPTNVTQIKLDPKPEIKQADKPVFNQEVKEPVIPPLHTPSVGAIKSGYGEYIVFRDQKGCNKDDIKKDVFEKVYQIFNKYSPAKIINDCPDSNEAQEKCADRYQLIRNEVKKIDEHLEIAFVPRTLFELIFIRKAINEDVKHNKVCLMQEPDNHKKTHNNEVEKRTKCWHLICFEHMGDNNDPSVKETAYRLNRVMIKTLAPTVEGFSHQKLIDFTNEEITFLQKYHKKCSASRDEWKKKGGGGQPFWVGHGESPGPAINFGYEIPSSYSPIYLRNEDAQIIRNAVALECSKIAQESFLLYRGANLAKDEPYCSDDHNNAYSLSYGSSLFAGILYDAGASAFRYARSEDNAYVIPVPFNKLNLSPFFIPTTNTLCQLSGYGESFHSRTKAWKNFDVKNVKGIKGGFGADKYGDNLKSERSRENLISEFHAFKAKAIMLK